jgi:hypothetical protein
VAFSVAPRANRFLLPNDRHERPGRARLKHQRRKPKTRFLLDPVAGFARGRLTGTNKRIYKVEAEKLDMI